METVGSMKSLIYSVQNWAGSLPPGKWCPTAPARPIVQMGKMKKKKQMLVIYKVKVRYRDLDESESKLRRQAIVQTVAQAIMRKTGLLKEKANGG